MRRLIILVALQALHLLGAADEHEDFVFVLRRIVNPVQQIIGGGTNNLVHFSCIAGQGSCHGFLGAGGEHDGIDFPIPVGAKEMSILLSVAKNRFQIFQKNRQSRSLIVQEYEKGSDDVRAYHEVSIDNLPAELKGLYPVVLQVEHGAKFACKSVQAVVSKQSSAPTSPRTIHPSPAHMPGSCAHSFDGFSGCGASQPSYAAPLSPAQAGHIVYVNPSAPE